MVSVADANAWTFGTMTRSGTTGGNNSPVYWKINTARLAQLKKNRRDQSLAPTIFSQLINAKGHKEDVVE